MDVGTVQSPAVNVTMPGAKAGDAGFRSRIKPLAPMGTCIGANKPLLRGPAYPFWLRLFLFHIIHLSCGIFKGS